MRRRILALLLVAAAVVGGNVAQISRRPAVSPLAAQTTDSQ
jgi:hypothetical protein